MGRYQPYVLPSGAVLQSGMNMQDREGGANPMRPLLGIYRGVVLFTYATDDGRRKEGPRREGTRRVREVECDVLLVQTHVYLQRVPVQQPNHGVNNAEPWIPRPSTRVIGSDGSTSTSRKLNLNRVSRAGVPEASFPPQLEDLDGDVVLIQFIEGDLDKPMITGAITHEHAKRLVIGGDGWAEGNNGSERGTPHDREKYMHHQGTEVRVNRQGDYLIDTVGAHNNIENEDPASGQGQIRFRVKNSERLTIEMDGTDVLEIWKDGSQVRVDFGEGATERLVLGDRFKTFLNNFFSVEYDVHTHSTGMGPTGAPAISASPMGDDVLSDLAKAKKS